MDAVPIRKTIGTILRVRCRPGRDTAFALSSYLLVVAGLLIAFQVFTTQQVAANFITFGPVTLVGFGVAVPVFYTVLARRRPLADLGLTTRHLLPSLALGLLLGLGSYSSTLDAMDTAWTVGMVPLATMALAVGLFEAVFFRGWLQLRFEAAFGLLPGLVLAALCYSLYHVGYGMAPDEMVFLFVLGLVFGAAFRLTSSAFVLWPFFTPVGGFYTTLSDGLTMPLEATYGFVLTMGLMATAVVAGHTLFRRAAKRTGRYAAGIGTAAAAATQGHTGIY